MRKEVKELVFDEDMPESVQAIFNGLLTGINEGELATDDLITTLAVFNKVTMDIIVTILKDNDAAELIPSHLEEIVENFVEAFSDYGEIRIIDSCQYHEGTKCQH
jgi:hypothetical protein